MTSVLIPSWERSPRFRRLESSEKEELTRKLLYVQEVRGEIPDLVRFASGFSGVHDASVHQVIQGKYFNQKILETLYDLAFRFKTEGTPVSIPPKQKEGLTGTALLIAWMDEVE